MENYIVVWNHLDLPLVYASSTGGPSTELGPNQPFSNPQGCVQMPRAAFSQLCPMLFGSWR